MSTADRHQKVFNRVYAEHWAKVRTVALVDGKVVRSHHPDFASANKALCEALDRHFEQTDPGAHELDMKPLARVVPVGEEYKNEDVVWLPS